MESNVVSTQMMVNNKHFHIEGSVGTKVVEEMLHHYSVLQQVKSYPRNTLSATVIKWSLHSSFCIIQVT